MSAETEQAGPGEEEEYSSSGEEEEEVRC